MKDIYNIYFPDKLLEIYKKCYRIKIGCSNRNDRIKILQSGYPGKLILLKKYKTNYIKDTIFKKIFSKYNEKNGGSKEFFVIPINELKYFRLVMNMIFEYYDNYKIDIIPSGWSIKELLNLLEQI